VQISRRVTAWQIHGYHAGRRVDASVGARSALGVPAPGDFRRLKRYSLVLRLALAAGSTATLSTRVLLTLWCLENALERLGTSRGRAAWRGVERLGVERRNTLGPRRRHTLGSERHRLARVTRPGIGTGVKDASLALVGVLGVEAPVPSSVLRCSDMDCQAVGLSVALFPCTQPVLRSATPFPCPTEFPDGEPS